MVDSIVPIFYCHMFVFFWYDNSTKNSQVNFNLLLYFNQLINSLKALIYFTTIYARRILIKLFSFKKLVLISSQTFLQYQWCPLNITSNSLEIIQMSYVYQSKILLDIKVKNMGLELITQNKLCSHFINKDFAPRKLKLTPAQINTSSN